MRIQENRNEFNPVTVTGVATCSPDTGFTKQRKPWSRFSLVDDDDGALVVVVCYDVLAESTARTICTGTRAEVIGYRPSKPRAFQRRDGTVAYSQDVNARYVNVLSDSVVAN